MSKTSLIVCEGLLEAVTSLDKKLAVIPPTSKTSEPILFGIHKVLTELDTIKGYTHQLIDKFKTRECAEIRVLHKVLFIEDIARTRIYTIKYYNQKEEE
jgi:hypothetical protein